MPRALTLVLDSVGCGGAPDAAAYGDEGADTLGHVAEGCAGGRGDRAGLRAGPLRLPHLARLGLGPACAGATGRVPPGLEPRGPLAGLHGHAIPASRGKDTPSGHLDLMGLPLTEAPGLFPDTDPAIPPALSAAIVARAGLPGLLGLTHASGTAVIEALGARSVAEGRPIAYTSADSVLQIAAHEEAFGLARLYEVCAVAREECDPYRVGRVIARPFTGDAARGFTRTGGRRDYAMPPPGRTFLDALAEAGREVVTVGKLGDVFAHRSTGRELRAHGNAAVLEAALTALGGLADGGFVFANLVDFDTEFGHRRDLPGYAAALETFDARVPAIEAALAPGDLALVTADHGNDPTWPGTDHTRECVPMLAFGPGIAPAAIGPRAFSDAAASLGTWLGVAWDGPGRRFVEG